MGVQRDHLAVDISSSNNNQTTVVVVVVAPTLEDGATSNLEPQLAQVPDQTMAALRVPWMVVMVLLRVRISQMVAPMKAEATAEPAAKAKEMVEEMMPERRTRVNQKKAATMVMTMEARKTKDADKGTKLALFVPLSIA